jgi:hypothetical protein
MPRPAADTPSTTYVPLLDADGNPVWNDAHTAVVMVLVNNTNANGTAGANGTNGVGMYLRG